MSDEDERIEAVQAKLDAADREYSEKIHAIAEEAFKSHMRPFLRRNGLKFIAGNGTWFIGNGNGKMVEDIEDLDTDDEEREFLSSLLQMDCIMVDGHGIGIIMPDFDPEEADTTPEDDHGRTA